MRTLVTAILAALVASAAVAAAQTSAGAQLQEDDDKFVLENDHVSVWFQGKKPMLKVFPADAVDLETDATSSASALLGNESGAFEYRFTDVVEYRDLDGDLTPDENEVVARLNLNAANGWTVTQSEQDGVVTLNLTLEDDLKVGGKGLPIPTDNLSVPDRSAKVGLTFTLRSEDTLLDAAGVNVSVPATSIKYDFIVYQWPFVDAQGNRLALQMTTTGDLELGDETEVGSADVVTNETAIGALTWLASAQGADAAGASLEIPVRASATEGAEGETSFSFTYDLANVATLVHDPTIGVASADEGVQETESGPLGNVSEVPAGGVLVVAAGLAVAAVVYARRR